MEEAKRRTGEDSTRGGAMDAELYPDEPAPDEPDNDEPDLEAPENDVADQRAEVLQTADDPVATRFEELQFEADPADAAEQRRVVVVDDEDEADGAEPL
jgi:hypothetical protein